VSSVQNEALLRRYWEDAWSKGDLSVIDEVYEPTFMHNNGQTLSVEQFKRRIVGTRATSPDLNIRVDEIFSAGENTVVSRVTYKATMLGSLGNLPATGKQATFTGIDIFHLRDGKVIEHWHEADHLGMMEQFGLLPDE
jgi:predicted ester cyclase